MASCAASGARARRCSLTGSRRAGRLSHMSRPSILPYLEQLVAGGRRMAVASWAVVGIGLFGLLILTVDPAYEAAHRWVEALLWACLAWFVFEWLARLVRAIRAGRGGAYALSAGGVVDAMAAP